MEHDIKKCPVCGGEHPAMKFKKLPKEWGAANMAAVCPKEKMPILGRMTFELVDLGEAPVAPTT